MNIFYNGVYETLGKPIHCKIMRGDFNTHIRNKKPMETATGKFGLAVRKERGGTWVEWAISRKYNILQKKASRWTWKIPHGVSREQASSPTNKDITYRDRKNLPIS